MNNSFASSNSRSFLNLSNTELTNKLQVKARTFLDSNDDVEKRLKNFCTVLKMIVLKLNEDDGIAFERSLLDYMDICVELKHQSKKAFENKFSELTTLFCQITADRLITRHDFVAKYLDKWVECSKSISHPAKSEAFKQNQNGFQNFVHVMSLIGSHTLQTKMMELLFRYANCAINDANIEFMLSLFKAVTVDAKEIKDILLSMSREEIFFELAFQQILNCLNRTNGRSVASYLTKDLQFDDVAIMPYPANEGWIYFNRGTKNVDFSVSSENGTLVVIIHCESVQIVQVKFGKGDWYAEVVFTLAKPITYKLPDERTHDGDVKTVIMNLMIGDNGLDRLQNLIVEMFPGKNNFIIDETVAETSSGIYDTTIIDENNENNHQSISSNIHQTQKSPTTELPKPILDGNIIRSSTELAGGKIFIAETSSCNSTPAKRDKPIRNSPKENQTTLLPTAKTITYSPVKKIQTTPTPTAKAITYPPAKEFKRRPIISTKAVVHSAPIQTEPPASPKISQHKTQTNAKEYFDEIIQIPFDGDWQELYKTTLQNKNTQIVRPTISQPSRSCVNTVTLTSAVVDSSSPINPIAAELSVDVPSIRTQHEHAEEPKPKSVTAAKSPKRKPREPKTVAVRRKIAINNNPKENAQNQENRPKKRKLFTPRSIDENLEYTFKSDVNANPCKIAVPKSTNFAADELTTASFVSTDTLGTNTQVLSRIDKNICSINSKIRLQQREHGKYDAYKSMKDEFDFIRSSESFERGQPNKNATYSYRNYAEVEKFSESFSQANNVAEIKTYTKVSASNKKGVNDKILAKKEKKATDKTKNTGTKAKQLVDSPSHPSTPEFDSNMDRENMANHHSGPADNDVMDVRAMVTQAKWNPFVELVDISKRLSDVVMKMATGNTKL